MPLDHTKVRAARERRKLTQTAAAQLAGMPRPNWSRIEAGDRPDPELSTAEKVASALRVPLSRLLTPPAVSGK